MNKYLEYFGHTLIILSLIYITALITLCLCMFLFPVSTYGLLLLFAVIALFAGIYLSLKFNSIQYDN